MKETKEGLKNIELTNDAKYYTVPQIIDQAESIFEIHLSKSTSDEEKKKEYRKVKQTIYRALQGKPSYQPEGSQRKHMYPRHVVYNLLNSDCREYFIKIKREQAEKEFEKWSAKQGRENAAKAKEKLAKAMEQEEKAKYTRQAGKEFREGAKDFLDNQSRDETEGEPHILQKIKDVKEKIFFEYLFESLIDFDVDEYIKDCQNAPAMPEDIHASDMEAISARRLTDLHNYYTGRVDLAAVLRSLCNIANSQDTQKK